MTSPCLAPYLLGSPDRSSPQRHIVDTGSGTHSWRAKLHAAPEHGGGQGGLVEACEWGMCGMHGKGTFVSSEPGGCTSGEGCVCESMRVRACQQQAYRLREGEPSIQSHHVSKVK